MQEIFCFNAATPSFQ